MTRTDAMPIIDNTTGAELPPEALAILSAMFAGYQRVAIHRRFGDSFSSSLVLSVTPVRNDAAPELPSVVKLAPAELVQKEWEAYHAHFLDRAPNIAQIKDTPTVLPGGKWGGLRYLLVGSGVGKLDTLYQYCLAASTPAIIELLETCLSQEMGKLWPFSSPTAETSLRAVFDSILPVNLVIKPAAAPNAPLSVLDPTTYTTHTFACGDSVELEGLVVTKVNAADRSVTLNLPSGSGQGTGLRPSYRVRFEPVEPIDDYPVGSPIDSVSGVVTATRRDILQEQARQALGDQVDISGEVVVLPRGDRLPNPLAVLPSVLCQSRDIKVSSIHGDLNLDNLLVEYGNQTRNLYLIDFATARRDYVLHDLLRLETEVVTRLLPAVLSTEHLPAETIHDFYVQLHCALETGSSKPRLRHKALAKPFQMLVSIRKMAQRYLFDPNDWQEYYRGLFVHLLSALKLNRLAEDPYAPMPKQIAFWGAATIASLFEQADRRTPRCRPRVALAAILAAIVLAVALVAIGAYAVRSRQVNRPPGLPPDAIAVMGTVRGQIKVQRHENELITATPGLPLLVGDVVTSGADAEAYIFCVQSGVFKLNSGRAVALTCVLDPQEGLELVAATLPSDLADLTTGAVEVGPGSLDSLESLRRGSTRSLADLGTLPIVLSPRLLITDTRPAFRWTAVDGATAYEVKVQGRGKPWSLHVDGNDAAASPAALFVLPAANVVEAAYPAGADPLEPQTTYLATVQALLPNVQTPRESDPFYFELADQATAEELNKSLEHIQGLAAPEESKAYLRALLFQDHQLWLAAADQLETLARFNPGAAPLIQMGDVYRQAGLLPLAEASYQRALESGRNNADLYTQAAALTGLGQAAYVAGNDAAAVEVWNLALALFRQLNEERRAEAIESLLAEISAGP